MNPQNVFCGSDSIADNIKRETQPMSDGLFLIAGKRDINDLAGGVPSRDSH